LILDGNTCPGLAPFELNYHRHTVRLHLQRVGQQILDDLPQPVGIGEYNELVCLRPYPDGVLTRCEIGNRRCDQLEDVHRLLRQIEESLLESRSIEQVSNKTFQAIQGANELIRVTRVSIVAISSSSPA